ncbi:exodeoxyribonuclease V subunit gamma [Salinicola endophyticus]|uniref:RecBCD enzyme subunit RecC n=1 Tax=Salinicola endophyticus TaxID=1949083 RepID=A0ABY8FD79_9GAMM|nr:exodeoxyribonuclease V subunit gamma [Salinicola endophyticus]WFF40030.1 exodeoxyribonuclease V subunit gamma [Salinicola endophyticus]
MFSVLHANHLEDLRDLSLALMQRQRLAPLTPETFLVQSNGMAQWLRLSLAEADGIAASVDFPLPSSFVWRAYRAVLEREGAPIPQHSPFDKRPLAWRILRLLEHRIAAEPEVFAPLAHYLSADAGAAGALSADAGSAAGALSADAGSAAGALSTDAGSAAGDFSTDTGAEPASDSAGAPGSAAEQAERKRWQLAVRLADLFDQYLNYRPDWLAAWEQGETAPTDLPADQRWQPALWRALLEDADPAEREFHRARLHGRFVRAARALDACPPGLPPRLFVFGISALPAQLLEALHALSGVIDVFLMITNPCRHYWGDIVSDREAIKRAGRLSAAAQTRQQERHPEAPWLCELDEEALHLQANPLLAAWGAQGRDFIVGLYEFESQDGGFDVETDLFQDPASTGAPSLLAQIQQDVLDLRHPGELAREQGHKRTIAADDASLSFYRVHSPLREVEVLHDRLLAAFDEASAAGAPLRPRDILVMVPEIDIYAPYIEAVFGQYAADDPRHVPFTIADQVASETHPLMVLVLALLELPERRLGVSELLDALDVPALRARFGIDEGELPRLRQWLAESGVRWGLSASHRRALGFPALHENSWAFGLERMLLGYSTGPLPPEATGPLPPESTRANATESAAWQFDAIVPYDEVGGLEADLAGRLAELVAALEAQRAELCAPGTPAEWRVRLGALLARMFQPAGLDEHDVLARVDQALGRWQASCELAAFSQPIGLGVVRDALKAELDEGGLAQRFLAGKVNFATLMPMRAIPFRHIYLLGMSDGAYPRTRQPQDFDLMAGRARPGDRSRRDDDRYLLLEALLSARDRLTLSWVGFDQRDNTPRPPSVLIGELLDMLEQGWQPAGNDVEGDDPERRLAERLIETHPLQPFSRRYFLADDPRFTYDASWAPLHGAAANESAAGQEETGLPETARRQAEASHPGDAGTSPQPPAEALGLNDLQRLLRRPWSVYLGRLGVRFQSAEVPDEDSEPFTLDALEDHTLRRELLDAGRRGEPLVQVAERLRLAGRLPAAGFGQALIEPPLKRLSAQLASWRGLTATFTAGAPTRLHFVAPAAGTTPALALEARLDELYLGDEGAELVTLETSHFGHFRPEGEGPWKKLGKPHRLHAGYLRWLLANAAGEHATAWSALFEDRVLRFPPLERALARETLAAWLACWWRAWCAPLPAAGELARTLWGQCGSDTLAALAAGEPPEAALRDTLAAQFEAGNFQVEALIRREGALGQLWPDFDSFAAAGGVGESVRHYQPLLDAMRRATQRVHATGERS